MFCKLVNLIKSIFVIIVLVVFGGLGWKIAWWLNLSVLSTLCTVGFVSLIGATIVLYIMHLLYNSYREFMEVYSPMKSSKDTKKIQRKNEQVACRNHDAPYHMTGPAGFYMYKNED